MHGYDYSHRFIHNDGDDGRTDSSIGTVAAVVVDGAAAPRLVLPLDTCQASRRHALDSAGDVIGMRWLCPRHAISMR